MLKIAIRKLIERKHGLDSSCVKRDEMSDVIGCSRARRAQRNHGARILGPLIFRRVFTFHSFMCSDPFDDFPFGFANRFEMTGLTQFTSQDCRVSPSRVVNDQ